MEIAVYEIANKYKLQIVGDANRIITGATSLDNQKDDLITWVKSEKYLSMVSSGVVVVSESIMNSPKSNVVYLLSKTNVKLTFSKILQEFFEPKEDYFLVNEVSKHRKNPALKISDNVFIGQNVTIGDGTVIFPNVVIEANSVIGRNCVLKSHVSIGTEGLGLELNPENDLLEKFPQLGKVIFEDHVEIGPTSTVRRGALKDTIVRKGTKIGSLVNIGHNCDIGENCILTCNIVTSGSSKIGNNVFIGVNVVVNNAIDVGDDSQIGMGAVVTKTLPENVVAYGNPAKIIRKRYSDK
ncbi:MAG: DapH/DapD/GlmU-related protein [Crocinitomicaceae bacterium]